MVESVDTLDSKSGEHYARAGSSPARGTNEKRDHLDLFFRWYGYAASIFSATNDVLASASLFLFGFSLSKAIFSISLVARSSLC